METTLQTSWINEDWVTVTEAAKSFGRTRQAIEQHIKAGRISVKRSGPKQTMHVSKDELRNLLASFAKDTSQASRQPNCASVCDPNEPSNLAIYKILFERAENENIELKREMQKLREENRENQKEILKLTHEFKSLLMKEPGIISWIKTLKR